ncbi:MAG TPA: Ig-like domain-containing protein [Polyangiaceae bacterium]|nr:Ig-like domain-containing protein [Polyangiaceae bacterium]
MRKTTFHAAAIALLLLACGDDGSGPAPAPKLTSIIISPADPVLADGATLELDVALRDEKGAAMSLPQGATLTWSSSDDAVASVSGDGTLTANSPGTTTIRAAVGSVQDETDVTVTQVPTELVAVSGEAQEEFAGEALPAPVVVEVRDRHDAPVQGVEVTFTVDGGSVTPESAVSDDAGQVSVAWTLGDEPGEQMLTAIVDDPELASITITATALDRGEPPVASADSVVTAQNVPIEIDVLANDTDPEGGALTVTGATTPAHGSAVVAADGTITYTPTGDYLGADGFEYTVADDNGNEATGAVAVLVVADLTAGLPVDESTLVLYKFDEVNGFSVDVTGNGHDGMEEGTTPIPGPWGGARELNGAWSRIDIRAIQTALQGSTTFTLEMLSRSEDGTVSPGLISHGCSNGFYLLPNATSLHTNLKTTGYTAGLCPWYGGVFGSEPMPRNDRNWHHYALVWDGAEMHSYRDGVLLGTRPVTGTFSGSVAQSWIGYNSFQGGYQAGQIDEVRVSTSARDSAELASNWQGLTWNWPRITAVSVAVAGDSLTLTGSNLGDVATVYIGGVEASIADKTPSSISVYIPNGVEDGIHDVMVETGDGRWGITSVVLER